MKRVLNLDPVEAALGREIAVGEVLVIAGRRKMVVTRIDAAGRTVTLED